MPEKLRILVVEDDPDFREVCTILLQSQFEVSLEVAENGNAAIQCLSRNTGFNLVLTDYDMSPGTGGDLIRFLRQAGSQVPVVIFSGREASEIPELTGDTLTTLVTKPDIKRLVLTLEKWLGVPAARSRKDAYVGISVGLLKKMGKVPADAYIRLSDAKYVRLIRKGEPFSSADFQKFDTKQVHELYLPAEELAGFLEETARRMTVLAEHPRPLSAKQSLELLLFSDHLASNLQSLHARLGVSPELQAVTLATAKLAVKSVQGIPQLEQLLRFRAAEPTDYINSHGITVGSVAVAIATKMNLTAQNTLLRLSIAGLLHDLPLTNGRLARVRSLGELNLKKSDEKFSTDDLSAFKEHPRLAASLVRQFKALPPEVDTIVGQHHEEPDGTGFPAGLGHAQISIPSAVFIVAHDLTSAFLENVKEFQMDQYLEANRVRYAHGPFQKVVQSLAELW